MKLLEIKAFPSKVDNKFSLAVQEFINKHGLKSFHGGQATVIAKDNHVWRAWFDDPGYETFLKYVEIHKSNKYLPKILSKVREEPAQFKGMPAGKTIKYVKLEKLDELPVSVFSDAIDTLFLMSVPVGKLPNTVEELAELSLTLKIPSHSDADNTEIRAEILKNKEFFKVVLDLMKHHDANDLNSGNVMLRGSIPVITDPIN